MAYNFGKFMEGAEGAVEWLRSEYAGLRTGRATPAILDSVRFDGYGSPMAINQAASITLEGPTSLRIVPWDKTLSKQIDSAIRESNLGVSVSVDDQGLRVNFPALTGETRQNLIKAAKQKLEEARVRVRNERERVHSDVEREEKEGKIGKDDAFRAKQDLQKHVDEVNKKLQELFEKKEKEILE